MKPASLLSPSNARGNWLGKVVEQLKQALSEKDFEQFENTYNDAMSALHWKYKQARQLTLSLRCHAEPVEAPCVKQLKLFAA